MNTKKTLLCTALFLPALMAFNMPGSRLRFAPAEGSSTTKTFESKAEFSLDHMAMTMNGQEMPTMPQMEMNFTTTQKIAVTDQYVANRDGTPKKLKRHFDDLGNDMAMSMKVEMMGQNQSNDNNIKSASELEGKTVVFTWDDEAKEYKKAFDPTEDHPDLLKGLKEDMDLRVLLPDNEVKEGDEWDIDVKSLTSVLAPGGSLALVPEDKGKESSMSMGMTPGMSNMTDLLGEMLEGKAKGKFTGTRDVGGAKMAVIKINIDIKTSKDMTEMVKDAMKNAKMPAEAEMKIDHMDVDFKMEGEGELVWNTAAGHMYSFDLSGPTHINIDMAMKIAAQGQNMAIEQSMEMSGTTNMSVKTE